MAGGVRKCDTQELMRSSTARGSELVVERADRGDRTVVDVRDEPVGA